MSESSAARTASHEQRADGQDHLRRQLGPNKGILASPPLPGCLSLTAVTPAITGHRKHPTLVMANCSQEILLPAVTLHATRHTSHAPASFQCLLRKTRRLLGEMPLRLRERPEALTLVPFVF